MSSTVSAHPPGGLHEEPVLSAKDQSKAGSVVWPSPAASRTDAATASPARRILLTRRTAARYAN
jgi:hypothetical protein